MKLHIDFRLQTYFGHSQFYVVLWNLMELKHNKLKTLDINYNSVIYLDILDDISCDFMARLSKKLLTSASSGCRQNQKVTQICVS